jgi:hypothetical protein
MPTTRGSELTASRISSRTSLLPWYLSNGSGGRITSYLESVTKVTTDHMAKLLGYFKIKLFFSTLLLFGSLIAFGQLNFQRTNPEPVSESICKIELILRYDSDSGKFGFVDSSNVYVIPPEFYCATEFINCQALVSDKKKCRNRKDPKNAIWHYINKANERTIPPRLENRAKWETEIKTAPPIN